jgi:hypothetical protein
MARRSLFSILSLIGLSGCSAGGIASDEYIKILKKDPMFIWNPSGNLARDESYIPHSSNGIAGGTAQSTIVIHHRFRTPGDVSVLLQEGTATMTNAGYRDGVRIVNEGYGIVCYVSPLNTDNGVLVVLKAPQRQ